jgi:hypothetical protein
MLPGPNRPSRIRALLPPGRPRRARPAGLPARAGGSYQKNPRPVPARPDPDLAPPTGSATAPAPQAAIPADPPGLPPGTGDPATALARLGDPADPARGFAPARSQHHRRVPAAARATRPRSTAITAPRLPRRPQAGAVLRALVKRQHDSVLTAISCLVSYLDTRAAPSTTSAAATRSPPDDHRRPVARPVLRRRSTRRDPGKPRATCSAAHRRRPARPRHALAFTNYDCATTPSPAPPSGLRAYHHAALSELGIGEPRPGHRRPAAAAGWTCPDPSRTHQPGRRRAPGHHPELPSPTPPPGWHRRPVHSRSDLPGPRQWGRSAAPPTWQRRRHPAAP